VRTSFSGEVKPSVPWCRFTACKRTLQSMSEMLWRQSFPNAVSPRESAVMLLDGSVLRRQVSHLLLIHTNFGYGTILMAACACQGCSATDHHHHHHEQQSKLQESFCSLHVYSSDLGMSFFHCLKLCKKYIFFYLILC
jgi:hypothetical protein